MFHPCVLFLSRKHSRARMHVCLAGFPHPSLSAPFLSQSHSRCAVGRAGVCVCVCVCVSAYLLGLAVVLCRVVLGSLLRGSRDNPLTLLELLGLLGGHFGGVWRR
jgi:hypothetical protein